MVDEKLPNIKVNAIYKMSSVKNCIIIQSTDVNRSNNGYIIHESVHIINLSMPRKRTFSL